MIKNIKRFIKLIIQDIKFSGYDVLLMMPIIFMILCILVMALYPEIIRWFLIIFGIIFASIFLFFLFEPCFMYFIHKWRMAKNENTYNHDRE